MRIRIWNAFASNNSGSYVIVGRFPSVELAQQVADELLEVAKAQSAVDANAAGPSPLAAYAAKHGLPGVVLEGDDWPEHSGMPHPDVWAVGHQVFVHSDFTVSMPPALGHLMYIRGGRVETELDHAHHAIVATFEVHVPWQTRPTTDVPARVQDIVDALWADDGPLRSEQVEAHPPAWRGVVPGAAARFGEPDLVFGAAFVDLSASFTSIARICARFGVHLNVRVSEAPGTADPFPHLRPCAPEPRAPAAGNS